jgi:hypothetical protein
VQQNLTFYESLMVASVEYYQITEWSWGTKSVQFTIEDEAALILLPQFISKVSNDASEGMLANLIQVIHKYPLLKYHYGDNLDLLRNQVAAAADTKIKELLLSKCAILLYQVHILPVNSTHEIFLVQTSYHVQAAHCAGIT